MTHYAGMVTTDWSECLAPCGPFDMIAFHYPHLGDRVEAIFRGYTGNTITLTQAMAQIMELLPAPLDRRQMDAYIDSEYEVYADVVALREWCRQNDILFMINSTGAMGYFQRVFARGLLIPPDALAAHPAVRFATESSDPQFMLPIREIDDKPLQSQTVAQRHGIPMQRIVVIGDSGGDGPHFKWGARKGATLVASLVKTSLLTFCRRHQIQIHHHWNPGLTEACPAEGRPYGRPDLDTLTTMVGEIMTR